MKRLKGITKRKVLLACSFLVLLIFIITFTLTYGRMNEPILDYDNNKLNGIVDNVIHINDLDADYYYYRGLNYTEKADGTLPTTTPQTIYADNRLVEVQLTYSGIDTNSGYRGYVSLGELQDTFIYYKIFPINDNGTPSNLTDDYIEIELIENPFTNRPTNRGFNGWKTNYSGVEISFDKSYYTRYAKVPVSYSGEKANKVEIVFNATWTPAVVSLVNSSRTWATAFNDLNAEGMRSLQLVVGQTPRPLNMSGYFKEVTVNYNQSYIGYYDKGGNIIENPSNPSYCVNWFVPVGAEYYNSSGTLQITQAGSGNICSKAGMIVFKTDTTYSNIATSGGQFNILVVAGGGSGARSNNTTAGGGGGGAGGLILRQALYIDSGNKSFTVGAGGIANPTSGVNDGRNGSNSIAFGLQAIGGGGGGASAAGRTGLTGGSGGGGGARGGTGGTGTSGQGNNGGNGSPTTTGDNGAGGGGGFSQIGGNGTTNGYGGAGGNGYNGSSIFGTNVGESGWFAGGGAGGISGSRTMGLGGNGGGGNGGIGTTAGQSGIANTGGGGGGSPRSNYTAGNGGSGVIIVQWNESIQTRICTEVGGCTFYEVIGDEYYNSSETYYEVVNGNLEVVDHGDLPFEYDPTYAEDFTSSSNMSTFFRLINIARYSFIDGYYDNLGNVQTGTCNTSGGCNLYQLIQYRNSSNQLETINSSETYYYLPTRDTNIIVMTSSLSNTWGTAQTKPFTLTSVSNGTDYRGSVTWTAALVVRAYNDTNIENIKISSGQTRNTNAPPTGTTTTRTLYGNWKNVRVGRGITVVGTNTTFATIMGGNNNSVGTLSAPIKYRLIIESGVYNTLAISNGAISSATDYVEAKAIYGNDYDRVTNNNNNLEIYYCAAGSWGGNIYASTSNKLMFDLIVKSGEFGASQYDYTTGIYVGGRQGGTHNSPKRIKVEGGYVYNLIGGPLTASSRTNVNDAYINMTGGEVDVIIGGAGTTATYGHRIIQVTGGTVNYSVFGGSNGYQGTSTDGTVVGSSFVYIGGKANIGNTTYVSGNQTIFGAEAGSVFGIGNGRSGYPSIGSSDNSNVMITEDAVIRRNVYGGGNFGATGIATSGSSTTNITLNGGTIKGDVYGGGNNNGSGSATISSTINIYAYDGLVEGSIYGGSNVTGTIFGNVNLNLIDVTVNGSVYGGGRGGYTNSSNPGTYVRNNINITVGDSTNSPTILTNIYGGSAFGSVNTTVQSAPLSNDGVNIVYNNGEVVNLFGGGKGDVTYAPQVAGAISVTINGGTVGSAFGGNDYNGTVLKNSTLYLNGGTITNVYGGGNQVEANITTIFLQGATTTTIYGGSNLSGNVDASNITTTSGSVNTIYGGNNAGGKTLVTNININGGTITNIYGGGRLAETNETTINLTSSTIGNVYGGGEQANVTIATHINLIGSSVTSIYGGSNLSGNVLKSYITTTGGNATNIYGGNNAGGKTATTDIDINSGTISSLYGGGKLADSDVTVIDINGGSITNVYGGGENADITNTTTLNIKDGTITDLYGGSNTSGTVPTSNISISSGTIGTVYGGNNIGGTTTTTNVTVNGGSITNVYGGGNQANTTNTTVTINKTFNEISQVYGGGKAANVSNPNVIVRGGHIASLYGGSNQSGTVGTTDINVDNTVLGNNVTATVNYNALDTESWQSTTYPTIVTATITLTNNTIYPINVWNAYLYIANSTLFSNYSSTLLTENNSMYTFNQANRYFGINSIPANGTYSFEVTILTMQDKNNVSINLTLLGKDTNNTNYNVSNSGLPNIGTIFGGNNNGGTTSGTSLTIKDANIGNIYGGGNQAYVSGNTLVDVETSSISGSLYGGGNNGAVGGNSTVYVTTVEVENSIYAGGNGATAVVEGNTLLNMDGDSVITNHVFGGGNAAATGSESSNNSTGIVNIAGGTIGGNVYGGANTSVLYGTTTVNIGYDIQGYTLVERNIDINGTVFGGGEANASGSENYDYSFISVTNGITININGDSTYSLNIDGSIFGSGNASSTTGYSAIYFTKYGTLSNHKRNISIQRANLVELDNSYIELDGATDRTNEYSTTLFTLSRIKELKLKNNSTIYLETGANLLEKVSSLVDISNVEVKASVAIGTNGNITKNVDNRIYIKEGKNLNIATNESVTAYGEVIGMTFFGMYSRDRFDQVDEAFFAPEYDYGDTVGVGEFYHFASGSYVLGRHATNHNIEADGFYTNEENEEALNTVNVVYITPTPEDSTFYMWVVGESIASYDISIAASKYSTLGTYELPLINFANPNTTFTIVGANFNELASNFQLVRQNEIPRISVDGTADTKMSLVMKTSNTGWLTVGETNFLTEEANPIYGTVDYLSENSTVVPSLLFYIYHSKNLQTSGAIGIVTISVLAITPIDDLTNEVERININIELSRVLYTTNDYEGAMTAGEEHDMFVTTLTDVTNKSKFSAYYSLYSESETTIYNSGDYRALVSSVVLPESTRMTLIDLTEPTPVYYYYVVSASDVVAANSEYSIHNEASYKFSKFIKMGSSSTSNKYNDATKNIDYYDTSNDLAHEEFVVIVDLALTNIQNDILGANLLIELRNSGDQTRISVLGIQHANLTYNVYTNKDAVIDLSATLSKNNIYIGEKINLNITSNFVQQIVDSRIVQDTTYYYKKLGLKITIYDSNNNIVNGASLMGTTFKYNNVTYYPQMDGIVRINVAQRVANISPKIEINTQYSNLSSGNYTIKIESFGSADGIYYGLVSSDTTTVSLGVLNNVYGLKTTLSDPSVIIDKETGNNSTGSNALVFTLEYSSGLTNPNIRVSAKRRLYDNVYSSEYALVDIKDYITNSYSIAGNPAKKEYTAIENPISTQTLFMYTKTNLMSGTYKIIFSIYDGNNYIGEVYNYVIIK